MENKQSNYRKYARYAGLVIGVCFLLVLLIFFILVLLDRNDQSKDYQNLQITNVGKNSFTVTWTSKEPYIGEIYCLDEMESQDFSNFLARILHPESNKKIHTDDRDSNPLIFKEISLEESSFPKKRYTHFVTIENLKPLTKYEIRLAGLVSAVNLPDEIAQVQTLENEVGLIPEPAYGYIENFEPADDSFIMINDKVTTLLSKESTYSFNLNELERLERGLNDNSKGNQLNIKIFNQNIQKITSLSTKNHKPLNNIDFSAILKMDKAKQDQVLGVLGVDTNQAPFSYPDQNDTQSSSTQTITQTRTQDIQEDSLSAFNADQNSEQINKTLTNGIPTYQVAIKPSDLESLTNAFTAKSPRVAGESTDEEAQIEVEESGRYSFFEGCERVGEVDVVINPGQNKAYLKLYSDDNGNKIKDGQEQYLKDIGSLDFSKEASAVDYELSTGWNLINLPIIDSRDEPDRIGTASELLEKWETQGAQIKSAAEFKAGQFNIFTKRESETGYGNDFELIPGDAIFVFNIGPNAEVTFSGNKFTSSVPINLNQGWNLKGILSIDKKFTSDSLLSDINSQGIGADMVSNFENGIYTTVVREDDQIYGNNFPVIEKYGYFINVESNGGKNYVPGAIVEEENQQQGYSPEDLRNLLEQNQQYIPENCVGNEITPAPNNDPDPSGDPSSPNQTCNNTFANQCRKVGENFAVNGAGSNDAIDRASMLNMGYTLAIATDPNELDGIANSFNYIISNGMKPILRICTAGGHCGFTDPNIYTNFVKSLSDKVANKNFLVITGANEPLTETWAGNQEGDPISTARVTTNYMNTVISSLQGYDNLTLLSPAFNLTNPYFEELIAEMKNQGANFSALDAISGNAYNFADGHKISGFVDRTDRAFSGIGVNKPIVLTEVGMFDNSRNIIFSAGGGTPHEQAMLNLKTELDKLKLDSRIMAVLLFDTFATNGSETFDYNFMSDQEHKIVLTPECVNASC